jgi:hypothetical protein
MPDELDRSVVDRRTILISLIGSAPFVTLATRWAEVGTKVSQDAVHYQTTPRDWSGMRAARPICRAACVQFGRRLHRTDRLVRSVGAETILGADSRVYEPSWMSSRCDEGGEGGSEVLVVPGPLRTTIHDAEGR